jgi:uncharacterized membrane protein YdcZ (DUF606 family)
VALSTFAVAAVTIMACVFAAATGVVRAEQATLARIEARAPQVKRWTGVLLVGVGVWFVVLAVFADTFVAVFPV